MIKTNKFWAFFVASSIFSAITIASLVALLLSKFSKIYLTFMLFTFNSMNFELVLLLDLYSLLFSLTVFAITLSVLLFSNEYMSNEKFFSRFHSVLMSFVLSMVILILSPNLLSALIGWDGLGVSSFILVIYYSSVKAYNAGLITAVTNRLGDGLMILSLVLIYPLGDLSLFLYPKIWGSELTAVLMATACFTKSAQIPFSAWLPAAMAAPTPVSSLVHSSTLVTAGVYILIRHGDWDFSTSAPWMFVFTGSLTMFMASLSAFFESDMKKMVALSTLSQLGVMVTALGVGNWMMSFLHLLAHAFFKALLFISAGNMIHSSGDYQAMKMSGSLSAYLPFSYSANAICSASLCGLPFMSAFFSKEPIIEIANESSTPGLVYLLLLVGVMMTVAYSVRLAFSTGVSSFQGASLLMIEENLKFTSLGMLILFPGAMLGGSLLCKYFMSNPPLFHSSVFLKIFSLLVLLSGLIFSNFLLNMNRVTPLFMALVAGMWSLPGISAKIPVAGSLALSAYMRLTDLEWLWAVSSSSLFVSSDFKGLFNYPSWQLTKFLKLALLILGLLMLW